MRVLNKQIALLAIGIIATFLVAVTVVGCSFDRLSIEKGRLDPNGAALKSAVHVDASTNKTLFVRTR